MINVALVISFLLHVIAFFIIILLYLQLTKVKEVEKKQSQMMKDMEEAVTAYLLEFKEENEKFLLNLKSVMQKKERKQESVEIKTEEELLKYLPKIDDVKDHVEINNTSTNNSGMVEDKDEIEDESKSIMYEALQLHKQGKSIEEIARILEKGKTEIELLLKFRQL